MKLTPLEHKITEIASPVAQDMGLEIYCVQVTGADGSLTVQVMAEDPQTKRIGADQCAQLSRAISTVMDVEDPISGAYRLEVSSPGIDRMLLRESDFADYEGYDVKLETELPTPTGQKKFRGVLKGIENGDITVSTDQGEAVIAFDALKKAKLVLTDDLIKKASATLK